MQYRLVSVLAGTLIAVSNGLPIAGPEVCLKRPPYIHYVAVITHYM